MPVIAIYAASARSLPEPLVREVASLCDSIAAAGFDLIFGGGNIGLMNVAAESFAAAGRRITSVIPGIFEDRGLTFSDSTEVIRTEGLRDRKRTMAEQADAYLALPGGIGTLDEFVEILTERAVGLNGKPLVLFDPDGGWEPLLGVLDSMHERGLTTQHPRELFTHTAEARIVLEAIGAQR